MLKRLCMSILLIISCGRVNAMSPLHEASKEGDLPRVQELIAKDPTIVNSQEPLLGHRSPLDYAIQNGYIDIARLLIEYGADVNRQDEQGWAPLHGAVLTHCKLKNGILIDNINIVRLLIEQGAKVDLKSKIGWTPLCCAQTMKIQPMVDLLTDHQRRIQEALQRMPIIASVLAMATHPRLGAGSLTILDQNLLRHISQLDTEAELHAARQPR